MPERCVATLCKNQCTGFMAYRENDFTQLLNSQIVNCIQWQNKNDADNYKSRHRDKDINLMALKQVNHNILFEQKGW